jgi:hypothetical protein
VAGGWQERALHTHRTQCQAVGVGVGPWLRLLDALGRAPRAPHRTSEHGACSHACGMHAACQSQSYTCPASSQQQLPLRRPPVPGALHLKVTWLCCSKGTPVMAASWALKLATPEGVGSMRRLCLRPLRQGGGGSERCWAHMHVCR